MVQRFWSAAGLRRLAELLRAEADRSSQKEIAACAGVSQQTITNLLLNLHNTDARTVKEPKPDTVLQLAGCLTNPLTLKPFDPETLLAVCRGQIALPDIEAAPLPFPAAVQAIRRAMGDRSLEDFAAQVELTPCRLRSLLTSPDPKVARPNAGEAMRLGDAIAFAGGAKDFAALYGDQACDGFIPVHN